MAKTTRPRLKQGKPRHFIREWRKFRGYTLIELGEIVGVTNGMLSQLERGAYGYTQPMLEALAEALACSVADLVSRPPGTTPGLDLAATGLNQEDSEALAQMVSAFVAARGGRRDVA